MRVVVDRGRCDRHGQCEIAAPDVFRLDDQGDLEYDEEPPATLRAAVEEAADACPLQAIRIEDGSP